jgi:hypothetical protein
MRDAGTLEKIERSSINERKNERGVRTWITIFTTNVTEMKRS